MFVDKRTRSAKTLSERQQDGVGHAQPWTLRGHIRPRWPWRPIRGGRASEDGGRQRRGREAASPRRCPRRGGQGLAGGTGTTTASHRSVPAASGDAVNDGCDAKGSTAHSGQQGPASPCRCPPLPRSPVWGPAPPAASPRLSPPMGTGHQHPTKVGRTSLLTQVEVATHAGATEAREGLRPRGSAGDAKLARLGLHAAGGTQDGAGPGRAGLVRSTHGTSQRAQETRARVPMEDRPAPRGVGQGGRAVARMATRSRPSRAPHRQQGHLPVAAGGTAHALCPAAPPARGSHTLVLAGTLGNTVSSTSSHAK